MALAGSVQKARPGWIGFDHSGGRINLAQARQYLNRGFRFCIRYISRTPESRKAHEENGTPDLYKPEAQDILSAGLALMTVQHVARTGWVPTMSFGKEYGENAGGYASEAGLLEGVNVWLDLEDIPAGTQHQDIIDYGNAWFDAVQNSGYEPGVYIGFKVWLSPDELFLKLKFKHYWRAPGNIPEVSHRGYQLIQHIEKLDSGEFDWDVTQDDAFGDGVLWHTKEADLIS